MRKKDQKQMPLMPSDIEHPRAKELDRISKLLDSLPTITDMVFQDLTDGVKNRHCGAQGMTAEQVLRAAIIKQAEGFSYEGLAFHLIDSRTYRNFCRIGITHKGFKKSALCLPAPSSRQAAKNIKRISPETWESINRLLVAYGDDKKIEKGKETRIDCTVVCSNTPEAHKYPRAIGFIIALGFSACSYPQPQKDERRAWDKYFFYRPLPTCQEEAAWHPVREEQKDHSEAV